MKGRILGIDPGLQCTGFGVVEVDGPTLGYVASGTIRTGDLIAALESGKLGGYGHCGRSHHPQGFRHPRHP